MFSSAPQYFVVDQGHFPTTNMIYLDIEQYFMLTNDAQKCKMAVNIELIFIQESQDRLLDKGKSATVMNKSLNKAV